MENSKLSRAGVVVVSSTNNNAVKLTRDKAKKKQVYQTVIYTIAPQEKYILGYQAVCI
jgi:hypothetical protein